MRFFGKAAVMAMALMGASVAMADCPVELPFENLMECLVEEGAGGEYPVEKVMKELNKQKSDGKQSIYIDVGRSADEV
ncbi:MAG TPA: hypothetical protein ENI97_06005 [Gammaproteobacteria bacterium]|nr:hypothetical protein [Gammaproteobacteria bacterium]